MAMSKGRRAETRDAEVWFHLTDNPRFALDSTYAPEDNSIAIDDRSGRNGIYLAPDVERWVNGYGYVRPFVAEFLVDPLVKRLPGVHGRWGAEMFVPAEHFDKVQLTRVIPLDAHAREVFWGHGWIEGHHGTEFDTGAPIQRPGKPGYKSGAFRGWRYTGPDVREMSHSQIDQHQDRWRAYMKENHGVDVEVRRQVPMRNVRNEMAMSKGRRAALSRKMKAVHAAKRKSEAKEIGSAARIRLQEAYYEAWDDAGMNLSEEDEANMHKIFADIDATANADTANATILGYASGADLEALSHAAFQRIEKAARSKAFRVLTSPPAMAFFARTGIDPDPVDLSREIRAARRART